MPHEWIVESQNTVELKASANIYSIELDGAAFTSAATIRQGLAQIYPPLEETIPSTAAVATSTVL